MSIIRHFEASPDERSAYLKMRRAVAGMSDDAVDSPEEEEEEINANANNTESMQRCQLLKI